MITFLVEFLFSYFLVFFYKFPPLSKHFNVTLFKMRGGHFSLLCVSQKGAKMSTSFQLFVYTGVTKYRVSHARGPFRDNGYVK